jgi:uncharacterized protein (TIGR02147 family)
VTNSDEAKFYKKRDFRSILMLEFEQRKMRRASYSIRAFARDLAINPVTLTAVLNKRHGISRKVAEGIADRLKFDARRKGFFCDLVDSLHARTKFEKTQAQLRLKEYRADFDKIDDGDLHLLSRWFYPAVLEIVTNYGKKMTASQISSRLRISKAQAEEALGYLQENKMILKTKTGYAANRKHLKATGVSPSSVIRSWHQQVIDLSKIALERQPVQKRKYLTSVFGLDSTRVDEARKWLANAHQQFLDEFATQPTTDSVYAFSNQFFQIDDGESADA